MSVAEPALRVVDGGARSAEGQPWVDVLAAALRPEFTVDVYYPERGEPILFGHTCAIRGCPGRGNSHPGRGVRLFWRDLRPAGLKTANAP